MKYVFDAQAQTENYQSLNSDDLAEIEKINIKEEIFANEQETKNAARAALLAKLGITEEEAKLLLS